MADRSESPEKKSGDKPKGKSDDDILTQARERFKLGQEESMEARRESLEDFRFRAGDQWPLEIKNQRQQDRRPCLTVNRIPQFVQQITNDQRQNRPSIKVHPVDDVADPDTAKIIQGLIRHIEGNSSADVAYDTAFEHAVIGGFGYFRILSDYSDHKSFNQELVIRPIRDPFSVTFDPYSELPDGSDASFAFVEDKYSPDEFKTRWPDAELTKGGEWESHIAHYEDWVEEDSVRVSEYFCKEEERRKLLQFSDGSVRFKDEIDIEAYQSLGLTVENERTALVPVINWYKMNGLEILERTTWMGKYIPIIPVYGSILLVEGKRVYEGIVRNSRDPQTMHNFWVSAETEAIALAPRAPYVAAEGQIDEYEADWQTANTRNHSVLKYKPISTGGAPVPPPQRNAVEPAVQAITQARMLSADDLKSTTGIYDAAMGNQSNETSGVAIQRRNLQSQTSNFHFVDNLTRSLKHAGRILVDVIPHIYSGPQATRIIGDDDEEKIVRINEPFRDGKNTVLYALDTGKYDVTVDVGPSFASKRQEAVQALLEVIQANPQIAGVAGDLIVKNMDFPGASELAERLKKTIPPDLLGEDDGEIPPQMKAQMAQTQQMIEQLTEQLNEANDKIDKKTLELESRERIELKKLEVQLEIENAKLRAQDDLTLLEAEIEEINMRQELLRENEMVNQPPPPAGPGPGPGPQPPVQPDAGPPPGGAGEPTPTGGPPPGTSMGEEP